MGQKSSSERKCTYEEYMISVRKNVCPYDEYQQCFKSAIYCEIIKNGRKPYEKNNKNDSV